MSTLTLLIAEKHLLCKVFTKKPNKPITEKSYGKALLFRNETLELHDLKDAYLVLKEISSVSNICFIRGNIREGFIGKTTRRLLSHRTAFGIQEPTIETDPNGKNLLMLDFDDVSNPTGKKPGVADIERLIIKQLPPEFSYASFFYQFSSSAGIYGWSKIKIHLFFWLEKPLMDDYLKIWAKDVNKQMGRHFIDDCVFGSAQINYIANPIVIGMVDPLGDERWGFVQKTTDNLVLNYTPIKPKPIPDYIPTGNTTNFFLNRHVTLDAKLREVGGSGGFRMPLRNAIFHYIASCQLKGISPNYDDFLICAYSICYGVLCENGRGRYLNDYHLRPMFDWVEVRCVAHRISPNKGYSKLASKSNAVVKGLLRDIGSINAEIGGCDGK